MISDVVLVALIAGIPPTLVALGNLYIGIKNTKKLDGVLKERVAAAKELGHIEEKAEQGTTRRIAKRNKLP